MGLHVVLLLVAFLAVAGPMLSYALSHPDEWNARLNQVGIIQSGWLEREPELTGKSTAHILAEQFLRAAGAFHVFPDRTVWYGAERPLLGFLAGAFAVLGMAWAGPFGGPALLPGVDLVLGGHHHGRHADRKPPVQPAVGDRHPGCGLLVAFGLEHTVA